MGNIEGSFKRVKADMLDLSRRIEQLHKRVDRTIDASQLVTLEKRYAKLSTQLYTLSQDITGLNKEQKHQMNRFEKALATQGTGMQKQFLEHEKKLLKLNADSHNATLFEVDTLEKSVYEEFVRVKKEFEAKIHAVKKKTDIAHTLSGSDYQHDIRRLNAELEKEQKKVSGIEKELQSLTKTTNGLAGDDHYSKRYEQHIKEHANDVKQFSKELLNHEKKLQDIMSVVKKLEEREKEYTKLTEKLLTQAHSKAENKQYIDKQIDIKLEDLRRVLSKGLGEASLEVQKMTRELTRKDVLSAFSKHIETSEKEAVDRLRKQVEQQAQHVQKQLDEFVREQNKQQNEIENRQEKDVLAQQKEINDLKKELLKTTQEQKRFVEKEFAQLQRAVTPKKGFVSSLTDNNTDKIYQTIERIEKSVIKRPSVDYNEVDKIVQEKISGVQAEYADGIETLKNSQQKEIERLAKLIEKIEEKKQSKIVVLTQALSDEKAKYRDLSKKFDEFTKTVEKKISTIPLPIDMTTVEQVIDKKIALIEKDLARELNSVEREVVKKLQPKKSKLKDLVNKLTDDKTDKVAELRKETTKKLSGMEKELREIAKTIPDEKILIEQNDARIEELSKKFENDVKKELSRMQRDLEKKLLPKKNKLLETLGKLTDDTKETGDKEVKKKLKEFEKEMARIEKKIPESEKEDVQAHIDELSQRLEKEVSKELTRMERDLEKKLLPKKNKLLETLGKLTDDSSDTVVKKDKELEKIKKEYDKLHAKHDKEIEYLYKNVNKEIQDAKKEMENNADGYMEKIKTDFEKIAKDYAEKVKKELKDKPLSSVAKLLADTDHVSKSELNAVSKQTENHILKMQKTMDELRKELEKSIDEKHKDAVEVIKNEVDDLDLQVDKRIARFEKAQEKKLQIVEKEVKKKKAQNLLKRLAD